MSSNRYCWVSLLFVILLSACGGGGGDSSAPAVTPPASVFAADENAVLRDDPAVYAVEETAKVLQADITTRDGIFTLAQVDADIDDTDAVTPEVEAHIRTDNYADDGKAVNATLRLRGHSSRLADQKSYRVKLASGTPLWRGESTFQLNKHPYDLTRVRNKLAFDLFRDIPHLPSLRTQFVHVTLNGQDYGLFTHVEKMGKEYLLNRGLPTDGNIYKPEDFSFLVNGNLALDAAGKPLSKTEFEKTLSLEADNKDHRLLLQMLAEINDPDLPFDQTFERYFDKSNYLTWLAVNVLMGNRDTVNQNFALYQPKGSEKFYFLPWDYDGSLGFEGQPDILAANNLYGDWQLGISNWWGVGLHRRFMSDPKHLQEVVMAVDEIRTNYLAPSRIQAKLAVYRPQVRPWVAAVPDLDYLPAVDADRMKEWDAEFARLASVIQTNRDLFVASLQKPMPYFQAAEQLPDGSGLRLGWDASHDFQGGNLTYHVRVSKSPGFETTVVDRTVSNVTEVVVPVPAVGVYYLKVEVSDNAGHRQLAFDRLDQAGKTYFGVLEFTVN